MLTLVSIEPLATHSQGAWRREEIALETRDALDGQRAWALGAVSSHTRGTSQSSARQSSDASRSPAAAGARQAVTRRCSYRAGL